MKSYYKLPCSPLAPKCNQVVGEKYRITFLSECLVRLEYDESGLFCDYPTQTVINRDFPPVDYTIYRKPDGLVLRTSRLEIQYNEECFSAHGLAISIHGGAKSSHGDWHYGDKPKDLHGTARTLDEVNGDAVELGSGIVSGFGYAVLDDSRSLTIQEDGWVSPRRSGIQDLYFFGYGHDYLDALRDFYRLCGQTPMLPRYALGNWWSRFYKYSQRSYLALMDRFEQENIPLSVAVIDMDWHLVDIDPKYGIGWTGFTWNKELFPDHVAFLAELHRRGLHTTLNLHPADGIRSYEIAYPKLANHMHVDMEQEEAVLFDPSDPIFLQHYYEDVLHPMEEEGVDFWWVDWQQGNHTKVAGLDSLWVLNHYGYLDNARDGKRPLAFSRYAGPGSHRYPVGFSGDTIITWESLRFQPYFTATASNIGYGWWSHDIGGHMRGYKDDELTARWTQLGVFSPILRLHSSCSEFNGKEPWRFKHDCAVSMTKSLQLRHRLLPYLYTMNYRSFAEGIPLILPLYYLHPDDSWAYNHDNEFYFGSELLVLPITSPRIEKLNVAKESVYLPDGIWYDFFSHQVYRGDRELRVYRDLNTLPVFAKAGSIIPLTDDPRADRNPEHLLVSVFLGADGAFTLYEDDGCTQMYQNGSFVTTRMELKNNCFYICAANGDCSQIPVRRSYTVEFVGCSATKSEITATVDDVAIPVNVSISEQGPTVIMEFNNVPVSAQLCISFVKECFAPHNKTQKNIFEFLNQAEIEFDLKDLIFSTVKKHSNCTDLLSELYAMNLNPDLYGALAEMISAFD